MLPKHYVLDVETGRSHCSCGCKLKRQWLRKKKPIGLLLGMPDLREHVKKCSMCGRTYGCEELQELIPSSRNYSYDLIVLIGMLRYREGKLSEEIQAILFSQHQLIIPQTTINELSQSFLDYLYAVHTARREQLSMLLFQRGGYILAIDGTCEAGTEVLFAGIDEQQGIVLWVTRMPTENERDITTALRNNVAMYGKPHAILRDLSFQIQRAVETVLPDVPDFICHYHFLRVVGEKLCCSYHRQLTNYLSRTLKLRPALSSLRKDLIRFSKESNACAEKNIDQVLGDPTVVKTGDLNQLKRTLAYTILRWLIDSNADLNGEYIPFDLPSLAFYHRACKVYDVVMHLLTIIKVAEKEWRVLHTMRKHLAPIKNDPALTKIVERLEKAEAFFSKLRQVLELSKQKKDPTIRQQKVHSTTGQALRCERKMLHFYRKLQKFANSSNDRAQQEDSLIIVKYLDKYWSNLFGHCLQKGIVVARTNNTIERTFNHLKYGLRRLLGTKKITRVFGATRAAHLLIVNLKNRNYIDYVFEGDLKNMPRYFRMYGQENITIRKERKDLREGNEIVVTKKCLRRVNIVELVKKRMETVAELQKTG